MRNHFLSKTKIPEKLPLEMKEVIEELKRSSDQEQCLKRAYEIMVERYKGYHFRTYTRPIPIFSFNVEKLWDTKGFMHCHNMTYLLRILLVRSGFFQNDDLKNKWTLIWYISVHQYLQVTMESGDIINVDIWGANNGIKFGDYAHGFH